MGGLYFGPEAARFPEAERSGHGAGGWSRWRTGRAGGRPPPRGELAGLRPGARPGVVSPHTSGPGWTGHAPRPGLAGAGGPARRRNREGIQAIAFKWDPPGIAFKWDPRAGSGAPLQLAAPAASCAGPGSGAGDPPGLRLDPRPGAGTDRSIAFKCDLPCTYTGDHLNAIPWGSRLNAILGLRSSPGS